MGELQKLKTVIKVAIMSVIKTVILKVLIVVVIVTMVTSILAAIWLFLFGDIASADERNETTTTTSTGNISLTTASVTEQQFKEALTALYEELKTTNNAMAESFKNNFANRAEDILKWSKQYGVNPELVITMAWKESGFQGDGNNQNFWGLDTPNGSPLAYIATFEEGVQKLASTFEKYQQGGALSGLIEQKYNERKAANCNQNGYGEPGTLKGMLSVYSDLCGTDTIHREGNSGSGGNYILREFVYTKPGEFEQKCGSVHRIGIDEYTIQEKADYTAALYEQQINLWNRIFGKFTGNINTTEVPSSFLEVAKSVWLQVCQRFTTYGGTSIPPTGRTIDCSAYVSWVLYEYGYTEFEGGQTNTQQFFNTNWNQRYGWTEIQVNQGENPINELRPGDIFVKWNGNVHHMQIIAEVNNGVAKAYDCGNENNWKGRNGNPYEVNWFLQGYSAPGKIIRVTEPE